MTPTDATLHALDWPFVVSAVADRTATERGAQKAACLALAATREEVRARFDEVAEVWDVADRGETIPLVGSFDVGSDVDRAAQGMALSLEEIAQIGEIVNGVSRLYQWLAIRAEDLPALWRWGVNLQLDGTLQATLETAFDDAGYLSSVAFPELGRLRAKVQQYRKEIRKTMETLVLQRPDGPSNRFTDALRDRFVTERSGRPVVPVQANRNSGLGIVHGASKTGETVYVEPFEVIEPTNALIEVEAAVRNEELRIMVALSAMIGQHRDGIQHALDAAAMLDVTVARARLGRAVEGAIPEVGTSGVMKMTGMRHPILVLQDAQSVVPNDLAVGSGHCCLVLTGPNAGGKTVALKCMGLAALMVRAGLPIPADEGMRVDLFGPIFGLVGDAQGVENNLSTFSAHLMGVREVLDLVADARITTGAEGAVPLVLLDELGGGTDPAQGAALARSVLESLVEHGARVVVTTHYAAVKAAAASNENYQVAATEFLDGRPTYTVLEGIVGESHALAVASDIGIPQEVISRARSLMEGSTLAVSEMMGHLDSEAARLRQVSKDLDIRLAEVEEEHRKLEEANAQLKQRKANIKSEVASGFAARLRQREAEIKKLIKALQTDPNLRLAGKTLAHIKEIRGDVQAQTSRAAKAPIPAKPVDLNALTVGARVRVGSFGAVGTVTKLKSRGRVEVRMGVIASTIQVSDIVSIEEAAEKPKAKQHTFPPVMDSPSPRQVEIRSAYNTCDLRGKRVDEGIEEVERFLAEALLKGEGFVYVLHGHGTGALKKGLRTWLKSSHRTPTLVASWRPASNDEGGEAFTVIEIKDSV